METSSSHGGASWRAAVADVVVRCLLLSPQGPTRSFRRWQSAFLGEGVGAGAAVGGRAAGVAGEAAGMAVTPKGQASAIKDAGAF